MVFRHPNKANTDRTKNEQRQFQTCFDGLYPAAMQPSQKQEFSIVTSPRFLCVHRIKAYSTPALNQLQIRTRAA